jgi:hypothetical protein
LRSEQKWGASLQHKRAHRHLPGEALLITKQTVFDVSFASRIGNLIKAYKKSMPAIMPTARFSLWPRRPKYRDPPNMMMRELVLLCASKLWRPFRTGRVQRRQNEFVKQCSLFSCSSVNRNEKGKERAEDEE